jgi:hypothetical protein
MRHFLKRTMLLVVPFTLTALVLGIPTAAPDDGLTNVTLTCSDGTNLDLSLDTAGLTGLESAVTGIGLYPAGDPPLTCGLTQAVPLGGSGVTSLATGTRASVSPKRKSPIRKSSVRTLRGSGIRTLSASGNPQYDYAVGGGQAPNLGCPALPTNFALNAHVVHGASMTTASGTFNVGSPAPNVFCQGHLNSKVDCLVVTAPYAHLTASVTQATGIFSGLQGTEIDVAVLDSNTPDLMDDGNTTAQCIEGKDFAGGPTAPDQPLTNGNISVHEAP